MASRYMNYLRKHQKIVLAWMCVVCMVTFVIGPYLLDMFSYRGQREADANPTVVTWTGGTIKDHDLRGMRDRHRVAVNFLGSVIVKTVDAKGTPVIFGRPVTQANLNQAVNDPGIDGDDSDEALVRRMLLARRAEDLGITVNRESVFDFLRQLSSPELVERDWLEIAQDSIPDGLTMSVNQLFDQLEFELEAQHVQMLAQAGLNAVSPSEAWDYHNRLNRRLSIEAYPVAVEPLIAQVGGNPTRDELLEIFDKGRSRDPNPNVPDPGFHKPHKIAFQYLKIDFRPFLDEAKKQITDEQIAKQYELGKTQGKYKVLDLPEDPTKAEATKAADGKPADNPADSEAPKTESPATTDKPAETPAEPNASEKPAEPTTGDTDKPEAAQPCGQDQAEEANEQKAAEQPADQPAKAKAEDARAADATKAAEQPAAVDPAPTPPSTTPPADAKVTTPPPPKFKPLEEVKEEIRTELAQPIAQEAQTAAIKAVTKEITDYGKLHRRWITAQEQKNSSVKAVDPGPFNLEAIAAKHGFKSGSTPLVDRHDVAQYEIGKNAMLFDMRQFATYGFGDIAFGRNDPLYLPQQVNSIETDVSYLFWRTAEEEAADITFDKVKPQLEAAWKKKKAFEMAQDEAKKLAAKATAAKSLKDVVDPTKVITPPPFSWLSGGSLAFGFGEPEISPVMGIDLAGREFMEGVFKLSPGQTGTAPNLPHTVVYVVRAVSQEPSEEILRQQFLETGVTFPLLMVASRERGEVLRDWYESLDKEMKVVWHRPPQPGSMN